MKLASIPGVGCIFVILGAGPMQNRRRQSLQFIAAAGAAILVLLSGYGARSQSSRTIKVVVPLESGGGMDVVARILVEQVNRTQDPTMVIENRPGGGTVVGTEAASRAAPDGNTLLVANPGFVISSQLRKLNYHPLTSFEPICQLVRYPSAIVVNAASPYRTLTDLVNEARKKPGELTMANFFGTSTHIGFEVLKRKANVDMTFVPYPGAGSAVNALLGEHVTSAFVVAATVSKHVNAGTLRALATTSRIESLPNVPTIAASGYADYEMDGWIGLLAPGKTPKETLAQIARRFTAALLAPDVREKFAAQEQYPVGMCGADFGAFLRQQYDEYGRVIREANIKAE
jgi:tripartite-type tricarboxylate transporter receptor subunit TctC